MTAHPQPPLRSAGDRSRRGFGLRVAAAGGRAARGRRRQPPRQRGIAILAVITAIAIALMIVNEFASRTTIDMLQARNTLDQSRAHFLARSAVNLGELLLRMQKAIDDIPGRTKEAIGLPPDLSVTEFSGALMAAFGGDEEQVKGAIGVTSIDDVKGLGADIGQFNMVMVPVDGKINVNCAAGTPAEKKRLSVMLKSLFFPFATNAMFDDEDAEGWRRDFETQVEAIIDYIDVDTNHVDVADRLGTGAAPAAGGAPAAAANDPLPQGGGEDYGYENLRDRYQAKNDRIDSVGELRLVRGIDDRMWTLFGNAFRVHGGCQISVRALDDPTVIAAVISASVAAADEGRLRTEPNLVWQLAGLVAKARQLNMTFPTIQELTEFIKNPLEVFQQNLAAASEAGANVPQVDYGVPASFVGLELDGDKVRKILTDAPPRAFQIEAYAIIARNPPLMPLVRTIRGMWDQQVTLQNRRWQGKPDKGAWQWLREE